MFEATSIVVASLIVCIAIVQLALAGYFYWMVKSQARRSQDHPDPNGLASVVMSVRGCDPTLQTSIRALLDQDYSNYEIHVVIDHRDDSAWSVAHRIKQEFDLEGRLTIHEMRTPVDTCGLKCNALVQALEELHPTSKYLVLIDADVKPHRQWLNHLLSPLGDSSIGVVTGNQWFEPNVSSPGSLIRSLWNAGAIVPTAIYQNPWAGSFAMRMEDVCRANLSDVWQRSVVDDGPIRQAIAPLGLSIYFQPSLIMVNREKCTLDYVNTYVTRMLTWSKLYEKTFINTVIHAAVTIVLLLSTIAFLFLALLWSQPYLFGLSLCAFIFNSTISALAYVIVRKGVDHSCQMRGESLQEMTLARVLSLALFVPATQLLYGFSCVRAMVSQQVKWRQITYEVKSKSQIRMLQYAPLLAEPEQAQSKVSI